MTEVRRRLLMAALKIFDLFLMTFSFVVASIPVSHESGRISFDQFFSMRVKIANFVLFSAFLLAWHIIFSALSLYHSRRLSLQRDELASLVKGTSLGTLVILAASIAFRVRMTTPMFLVAFWSVATVSALISRVTLRYVLRQLGLRGRNLRHMLVVGTNSRAVALVRKIDANLELGYKVVGFVDNEWPGLEKFTQTGYHLACNLDSIANFLRERVVDEVVIALPVRSLYFQASRVAALCEEQGIATRFLSGIFNLRTARLKVEEFQGDTSISFYAGLPEGWATLAKRLIDFGLSLVAIIALIPVFFLTAIVIKLTSPGPIFFRQKRLGINKANFSMYKFRTMVFDAESKLSGIHHLNEVTGPVFKIKNDPRITPIGRFLRKTSIDELPQLVNVLKGEMSLVGPRPLPMRDYHGFNQDWHRRRFSVPPGMTCLWQVGGRSSIDFEKWMELDLEYIDKWSLWLDFQILIRTIPAVLRGSGAA